MSYAPFSAPIASDATKLGLRRGFDDSFVGVKLWQLLYQALVAENFTNLDAWSVSDTGGKINVSGNVLTMDGSNAFNVNGIALTAGVTAAEGVLEYEFKNNLKNSAEICGLAAAAALTSTLHTPHHYIPNVDNVLALRVTTTTFGTLPRTYDTWYKFRGYLLKTTDGAFKRGALTIEGGTEYPFETELGRVTMVTAMSGTIYPQFQRYASNAGALTSIRNVFWKSGFAVDGPYLTYVADAGKLCAVSSAGTMDATDLEDPEASITGAVSFTGGATGILRSYKSGTGKANIHSISGTPQAGTVTCTATGHTFTISDTGVQCIFKGFDLSRFKARGGWATTNAKFRYAADGAAASGWLTLAQLNAVGDLGTPYRVVVDEQANSDGATQQYLGEVNSPDCTQGIGDFPDVGSVIPGDTVQAVPGTYATTRKPYVIFALDADDNSIAVGGTIDFSAGTVTVEEAITGAAVVAKIHNASTGAEIATVFSATGQDFSAATPRTLASIAGAAPTWLDDQGEGDYELRVTVTDDEVATETSRYGFAVVAPGGSPAVIFTLGADDLSIVPGGTIDFSAATVKVKGGTCTGATVTGEIWTLAGAKVADLFSAAGVDFADDVAQTLQTINGGSAVQYTDAAGQGDYELRLTVEDDDGEVETETSRYGFAVTPATPTEPGRPSHSAAPTRGDGQVTLHLVADNPADVLYPIWRTGTGTFTEPSESFKCTGTDDLAVTGLTNDIARYGFLVLAKRNDLWSLPSLEEVFCTPTAGSVTPSGEQALPLHYLRLTLAASAAFQAMVSAGDAEEALGSIHKVCGSRARGRATVSGGAVTALTLEDGGRGYRSAPAVSVEGPGSGATATATVSGGRVTGLVLGDGGSGYVGQKTTVLVAGPTLPMAIVDWMPEWMKTAVAGGSHNWFEMSGGLLLLLRAAIDPSHSEAEAADTFMNLAGAITEDLAELAGTGGYLNITGIRKIWGPQRPDEDELKVLRGEGESDYYQIAYAVGFEGA